MHFWKYIYFIFVLNRKTLTTRIPFLQLARSNNKLYACVEIKFFFTKLFQLLQVPTISLALYFQEATIDDDEFEEEQEAEYDQEQINATTNRSVTRSTQHRAYPFTWSQRACSFQLLYPPKILFPTLPITFPPGLVNSLVPFLFAFYRLQNVFLSTVFCQLFSVPIYQKMNTFCTIPSVFPFQNFMPALK